MRWHGRRDCGVGWLAQDWLGLTNREMKEIEMAQGGGVTAAYQCWVQAYRLETVQTSRPRTECATVDDARARLERGETVVVAGSDMQQLRGRLASFGIG